MNKIIVFIKQHYFWVILFLLLFAVRFIWIDVFPSGMQYDEIEYSLSGKTFQMMGRDLSGIGFPEDLVTTRTLGKASPVPYVILSPLWNFLDLNMTNYRGAYVVVNGITAVVFVLFLHTLFKKKNLSLLGGVFFLINPWSFFLSRHAIDGSFALLFYLLGSLFLLRAYSKKNIVLSVLFFLLGCFSYHGAKPYLIPLVLIAIIYVAITRKLTRKQIAPYVFHFLSIVFVLVIFVVIGKLTPGSVMNLRSHEMLFSNLNIFSKQVNSMRAGSIDTKLTPFIANKFMFAAQYILNNYFETFSPTLLFLHAEIMGSHGFFYFFEVALLLFGLVVLFHKERNIFWLIVCITTVVPITTILSLEGFSILNRAVFLLPLFLTVITYGFYSAFEMVSKHVSKSILIAFSICIYGASFLFFLYTYFLIMPVQLIMHYQTNTRVVARYISLEQTLTKKILVISSKPQIFYSSLVFFLPRKEQERELQKKQTFERNLTFRFMNNVTVTDKCVASFDTDTTYIIDKDVVPCFEKKIPSNFLVIDQRDASEDFYIVNGKACENYNSSRWLRDHRISDFGIESLSTKEFCERWIAK